MVPSVSIPVNTLPNPLTSRTKLSLKFLVASSIYENVKCWPRLEGPGEARLPADTFLPLHPLVPECPPCSGRGNQGLVESF